MPTLKVFVTNPDSKGRIACASLNTLQGMPFPSAVAPDVVDELSDMETTERTVQTEDDVAAYFGGAGEWHTVSLAPELTGTMEERIETLIYNKDGQRLLARQDGARAAALVKEWTFTQPVSFEGFQSLPKAIRATLGYELTLAYYAGVNDYAAFTPPSTGK